VLTVSTVNLREASWFGAGMDSPGWETPSQAQLACPGRLGAGVSRGNRRPRPGRGPAGAEKPVRLADFPDAGEEGVWACRKPGMPLLPAAWEKQGFRRRSRDLAGGE